MDTNQQQDQPIEILFSYAHEDEELLKRLEKHLSALKRRREIDCWYDRNILAGGQWQQDISKHLDTSDIILLLVSPDFLASEYCNDVEVEKALERHEKGEVCVIPVILRPADWHKEKFGKFQALPKDAKPIVTWSNQDEALLNVVKGIKKVITDLQTARKATAN